MSSQSRILKRTSVMDATEDTPLLTSYNKTRDALSQSTEVIIQTPATTELPKTITFMGATTVIVGTMAGTGIFISPTGVTASVGSVGASLIIWVVAGLFSMVLAFCYAELGTALPQSGGDYIYVQRMLGAVPAFICLWSAVVMASIGAALMARAFSLYFFSMLNLSCHPTLLLITGLWLHMCFSSLNCVTITWTTRLLVVFSVIKILALSVIVIMGIVLMTLQNGMTNFYGPFSGTSHDAGSWASAFVAGFVSYGGWESVNALAGEMKNPKRDLPLSLLVSIIFITIIYVLTNMAYFAVLTPQQFIASDAVAMTWAERVLPNQMKWIMPLGVAMAAAGSVNAMYLLFPRYVYAAGKDGHLPALFSHLHTHYITPVPGIVLIFVLSMILTSMTFIDIQGLVQMIGVVGQIKQILALMALLNLKRTQPHLPRTVVMPWLIVVASLLVLLAVTGLSIYQNPTSNLLGTLLALSGLPLMALGRFCSSNPRSQSIMEAVTIAVQRIFLVVP